MSSIYVSSDSLKKSGRHGPMPTCPAVPEELIREIIKTIKKGKCLFVHAPTESYLSKYPVIREFSACVFLI